MSLASDGVDRSHRLHCWVLYAEAAICYGVPFMALLFGTLYLPLVLAGAFADPLNGWTWQFITRVVLGWIGIAGVGRVMFVTLTKLPRDPRPALTLLAVGCGVAATLLPWVGTWKHQEPSGLDVLLPMIYLPLACTLHFLYLARRALFA